MLPLLIVILPSTSTKPRSPGEDTIKKPSRSVNPTGICCVEGPQFDFANPPDPSSTHFQPRVDPLSTHYDPPDPLSTQD